jgi:hypothetical protein
MSQENTGAYVDLVGGRREGQKYIFTGAAVICEVVARLCTAVSSMCGRIWKAQLSPCLLGPNALPPCEKSSTSGHGYTPPVGKCPYDDTSPCMASIICLT